MGFKNDVHVHTHSSLRDNRICINVYALRQRHTHTTCAYSCDTINGWLMLLICDYQKHRYDYSRNKLTSMQLLLFVVISMPKWKVCIDLIKYIIPRILCRSCGIEFNQTVRLTSRVQQMAEVIYWSILHGSALFRDHASRNFDVNLLVDKRKISGKTMQLQK